MLGLGLTAAGGLCLYFLTKERESYQVTSRQVELLIEIPRDRVKEVLGRGGSNIREIQVKTDTVIKVRDELETEEHRIVSIRGSPDSTQEAEILIQKILSQRVGQTEICVVTVPSRTVGRIVGCNGGVIWKIGNKTGCKVEVEVLDHGKSRIHLMGSTDGVHTARNIIQQKVKESDIKDLTFGKIGAFDIFTASKKNDIYVENIPPQLEDSGVSQVQAPYLSSRHVGLLHLALSCYTQWVDEYVGDVRQTTAELLPSGQVQVTMEKNTYTFLPSFPPDIDLTEDMEPDVMDPVSVQIQTARRLRRMGLDIASGGVKDIMLAECWLPSQLPYQTKFSCMCWNLDWDMSLTVTTVDQEQILGLISLVLNTVYSGSKPGDRDTNWRPGEDCVAVFPPHGTWHRAKIITVNNFEGKVQVRYVDYGSISWCKETR